MEPLVWVPSAPGQNPAATAAAEPLDEPPGVCSGLQGLRVLPGVRNANSAVTVLPRTNAPACSSLSTTRAEAAGTSPRKIGEPRSVGMPRVGMMSFTPIGQPVQRTERRARPLRGVRRFGALHRPRAVEPGERGHLVFHLRDARKAAAGQLGARDLSGGDPARDLDETQFEKGLHADEA